MVLSPARRVSAPRRPRGEGKWKLGYREPLSVRTRIEGGRDTADATDRLNVQLNWIQIEDVTTIWGESAIFRSPIRGCRARIARISHTGSALVPSQWLFKMRHILAELNNSEGRRGRI